MRLTRAERINIDAKLADAAADPANMEVAAELNIDVAVRAHLVRFNAHSVIQETHINLDIPIKRRHEPG